MVFITTTERFLIQKLVLTTGCCYKEPNHVFWKNVEDFGIVELQKLLHGMSRVGRHCRSLEDSSAESHADCGKPAKENCIHGVEPAQERAVL